MAALRDAGTPADGKAGWIRGLIGLVLTGSGVAALLTAAAAEQGERRFPDARRGHRALLIGFVVIGPLLAGFVVRVISAVLLRAFGPVGRLAERNAPAQPAPHRCHRRRPDDRPRPGGLPVRRRLLHGRLGHQRAGQDGRRGLHRPGQPADRAAGRKAMTDTPGLEHVTRYRMLDATLTSPDGKTDDDGVTAADPTYAEDVRRVTTEGKLSAAYGTDAMSVGSEYAKKHGVHVGDTLSVAFKGGETAEAQGRGDHSATTWPSTRAPGTSASRPCGSTCRPRSIPPNTIMFAKAEDGRSDQAYAALKKSLDAYPQYQVADQTDYKQELKDQIGQLLNMVYGLLALAIIVAVLGVVNTLALSVVERTREIGLMRAIGLSRRQLRRMIRMESVVIALFGALLGLGLGMGWGATAQRLLALEGLNVLDIPWPTIIEGLRRLGLRGPVRRTGPGASGRAA